MGQDGQGQGRAEIQRIEPTQLGLPGQSRDPIEVTTALDRAQRERCNVLAPRTRLEFCPPGYQLAIKVVTFQVDAGWDAKGNSNGIWYRTDGGGLALHRAAVDQLASLAGISMVPGECRVEELRPFVWQGTATIQGRDFTGQWRKVVGSRVVDATGGEDPPRPTARLGADDKRLRQLREHAAQHAATKAYLRAVRAYLGLRASYSREEAARPFVFPVLVWVPPTDDPTITRMVAAKELGIVAEVFGPATVQGPNLFAPADVVVERLQLEGDDDSDEQPRPAKPADPPAQAAAVAAPAPQQASQQTLPGAPPWEREPVKGGPVCEVCGKPLDRALAEFSDRTFGVLRCADHQASTRGGGK